MARSFCQQLQQISHWGMTLCVSVATIAVAHADKLPVPFKDSLSSDTASSWRIDAAQGNSAYFDNGVLRLNARQNTFAHIQRDLKRDLIRASCEINAAPGISWCPSVFLYWNPSNWCQLGVCSRYGGSYYAAEMIDGKFFDHEAGRVGSGDFHPVAIELGTDCVRYLTGSADGWTTASTVGRPDQFMGAPKLLILGKGHGGPAGYPAPDLNNNYADQGDAGQSSIRNVRVDPLEWDRTAQTDSEIAARDASMLDPVAEKELAGTNDPSYASVSKYFPGMSLSREVVGVKDHPYAIGVAPDGALQLGEDITSPAQTLAIIEVGQPAYRFGSGKKLPAKRLVEGWKPMVICEDEHAGLKLRETVFGQSEDMSTSKPLFACVKLEIENGTDHELAAPVQLALTRGKVRRELKTWKVTVPAHGSQTVCFTVPRDIDVSPVAEMPGADFEAAMKSTADYWEKLVAPAVRFTVPEERVQNAYRAWLSYNFLNTHLRDGIHHICDGSGFYGIIYGYSAALYCYVLDLYGYNKMAGDYLKELLTLQRPDGLWYVNFGHTDTGTMLTVLANHYRITGDEEWLRSVTPNMLAMCKWITDNRKESMHSIHGRRAVVHGLVRFRPYCDYELAAYDYYSNCYLCVGMEAAADVLGHIGMTTESKRLATEAKAYRSDILQSMDAAIITHDGMRMLPIMPETQFLLKETNYTANGYYGLNASCVLETCFLPDNDPRTQLLVDMLRLRGGLVAGVCAFQGLIDHAYAYGYWNLCMNRDEVRRVLLGFYGSLAYGMTRDTFAAVECTNIRTGENAHTLPHTYSNTKQLRLLRNMLVREDKDSLQLAYFVPREWLGPGKKIEVRDAPTTFGLVSYTVQSNSDSGEITAKLTPPARPAGTIKLRLRHPDQAPIKSAKTLQGIPAEVDGDVLTFKNLSKPVDVVVTY